MRESIPTAAIARVADAAVEEMTREQLRALEKEWGSAEALLPPSVVQLLRRAFTPRGMPFFEFYVRLRRIRLGEPVSENLRMEYRRAADRIGMVKSPVDGQTLSPAAVNQIALAKPLMERVLGALQQPGHEDDQILWGRLNMAFVPLLVEVAKDKGVYLKPTRQTGRERWATFMKMSPRQEKVERLRDEDPESYALMQQMGQTLEIIDLGIEDRIRAEGKELKKGFLAGRPVLLGVDPATGEESVYDRDGEVLPKEDFFDKRRAQADAAARATRAPLRTETHPKELRRLSDEELDDLVGDLQWDAITDDKAKQGRLTRIFPTKLKPVFISDPETGLRIERQKVVVSGRYKGVFLDDLVNSEGRLVEGTAYAFDPKRGQTWRVPKKMDPSEREPYVTVAEIAEQRTFQGKRVTVTRKKLYLKIDGTRQSKVLREAIKQLACNVGTQRGCIPSVSYEPVEGSNAAGFYFDPKDFGVVMQSLQGMSLSKAALDEVKAYYTELARAEAATQQLDAYTPDALGSESDEGDTFHFVQGKRDPHSGEWHPFRLLKKQQQAVAWLDANGNNGVCALDTGIGKTTTSIAMMLKVVRDGLAEPDATYERPDGVQVVTNGRFLFVCPTSLKGNLPKEIRNFISDPRPLLDKVDVVSYREFAGSSKSGKVPQSIKGIEFWKGRRWDPALYAAIFFDEAQEMKNPSSGSSQAALKLWHPRKVCLTASPMERNPMEAYVLAAITGNKPLFGRTPDAAANRQELKRFKERFCEIVGGRIVGVKSDPMVQRDLHTWVKRNVFYADKTEVDEYKLPTPVVETRAVEMSPEVEGIYRDVASRFATILEGAARKFTERTRGDAYADKEAERVFSAALRPVIKLLTDLSNRPAKALEDIAFAVEKGYLPGHVTPDGTPKELPRSLKSIIQTWAAFRSPESLREMAASVGNPKVETMSRMLADKLERAQGSRALVFADDRDLCLEAGMHLAKTVAGTHVVALDKEIRFFRAGAELTELSYSLDIDLLRKLVKDPEEQDRILSATGQRVTHPMPFVARAYRRFPMLPAAPKDNTHYKADNWQQFVLKEIVSPNPTVKTCTLLGKVYMYGHNLQAFNTVIHLDRNNWNSESMKQRTARAWRQGQDQVVEEITLDTTYSASDGGLPRAEHDKSLDQIREAFQRMDADIFDSIIKAAQGIELGAEWDAVAKKDATLWRLDRRVLELLASPFVSQSQPPGASA